MGLAAASNDGLGTIMILVALVGFWVLTAFVIAGYARDRGHSWGGFLALGLVVSPVLSGILALALGDRREQQRRGELDDLVKLAQLKDSGVLTPAEFDAEKNRILSAR